MTKPHQLPRARGREFPPRKRLWIAVVVLIAALALLLSRMRTPLRRTIVRESVAPRAAMPPIATPPVAAAARSTEGAMPLKEPLEPAARTGLLSRSIPESLRRSGATTIGEALAVAEQLADSSDRSEYFQTLLRFCLEIDPSATAGIVSELREAKLRDHGMGFLLGAWAERDPAAALQWAASHPRAENDSTWFCAAYEGFAARRPGEALAMLQRPELGADLDALARIVAFHLDDQGRLPEARAAVEKLPEGALREALIGQIAHFWALKSPGDAAAWLASVASDATFRDGMGTIVQTVAATEPTFAAGLAERFPDNRSGRDLLGDVVYLWAQRDLGGAAAWLRTQRPGPKLDAAVARLVEAIAPNDPVEAREWIAKISDPQQRTEVAKRLGLGG